MRLTWKVDVNDNRNKVLDTHGLKWSRCHIKQMKSFQILIKKAAIFFWIIHYSTVQTSGGKISQRPIFILGENMAASLNLSHLIFPEK